MSDLGKPEILHAQETEKEAGAEQLDLPLDLIDVAFDEMNLIEIPFSLLQRTQNHHTRSIALSPGGLEYLESSGLKYGLPTAFAEPTVLGMMWLTQQHNGFTERVVRFEIRDLVENYMFPGRFKKYRASGKLLKAVEEELHRIAACRIHSDRWYDRSRDQRIKIDASIIDYISIVEEGGKNSPRQVEIAWGGMVYQSIRSRYTKALDVRTYLKIKNPLARRFYRWVDRQLAEKPFQTVKSCQNFARYKMLMTGQKIGSGGRTASTYIVSCFREILENFHELGYSVRMTVDQTQDDFSLSFERIDGQPQNEVVESDHVGELVTEFLHHFHGVEKGDKPRRGKVSDRDAASKWLIEYGFEQARWMVGRCRELHAERSKDRVFSFKYLELYETAAAADYERWKKEQAGQLQLDLERETKREKRKQADHADKQRREAHVRAVHRFDELPESERRKLLAETNKELPRNIPNRENIARSYAIAKIAEEILRSGD